MLSPFERTVAAAVAPGDVDGAHDAQLAFFLHLYDDGDFFASTIDERDMSSDGILQIEHVHAGMLREEASASASSEEAS